MIVFDLKCKNNHTFEGWFGDNHAFETQRQKGLISCPVCEDIDVCKIPSTFGIKSGPATKDVAVQQQEIEQIGAKIADYVEKNFDDVGCNFAKEALKIHYGVTEPRNIRGVSTDQEEKTLKEEGVQFFKVPVSLPPETDS
ncbi:MAG: DUF1178 family protein [Deltaproteobacteria bacterium]|nr:DUF1178 family protein [Deltaproteobacteria bacterium]